LAKLIGKKAFSDFGSPLSKHGFVAIAETEPPWNIASTLHLDTQGRPAK
jgi:hypothetical protein